MKTFNARAVVVPKDLAEKFDDQSGKPHGYLRDLIADKGSLHHLDDELLAIGLMNHIKGIMEEKDPIDEYKPLSIERLSNVIYLIMFAYATGIMHVDDDGDVVFGDSLDDIKFALDVARAEQIRFPNGKTMPTKKFLETIKIVSAETSIGGTYKKVVTRQGLTRGMSPQAAYSVAKVAIMAVNDLLIAK